MPNVADRLTALHAARPEEGLFAEKDWLLSPEPFAIDPKLQADLERLGHQLFVFQRACNQLYQQSVKGKQPAWAARYLDLGKPPELIESARGKEFREALPRVIRPDLVLTDEGWTIAEIDSVPGGIGLTAWLNQTYVSVGAEVIGGAEGMLDGFATVLPRGGDILVSEESATYRPEMEWLVRQLNARFPEWHWNAVAAENYAPKNGRDIYRFFELFDLTNIPGIQAVLEAAGRGEVAVTPPIKPFLEEKMWFALFWLQPLRDFWRRELGDKYFRQLQRMIPYTWILDPTPLPQHAVIPRLEIHDWRQAAAFSQKERDLLLKVSGFSPLGWGSRGVSLGADLPHAEWQQRIAGALEGFEREPTIVQQFHKGKLFDHPYWEAGTEELKTMHGRVRLCPYYFIENEKAILRGALATVCPADKKLLHGMRDAILVPSRFSEDVD
ncbi:MAG: hypothetical protein H0X40_16700 [Chthoniobacterales bacterium]|nr:hypothetical protein [Chthoniobacterales bacterium]